MARPISFYELPNNIVGGALIPLSTTSIPLASVTISVNPSSQVILRGTVGWQGLAAEPFNYEISVLFKIWRGAANTGTLLYSIRDSSESWADRNKTTSFVHIDDHFTECKDVTYTLTAELASGGKANVVGPLLFAVTDINTISA